MSRWEIAEGQGAFRDALQARDSEPGALGEAADLAVSPFVNGDAEQGGGGWCVRVAAGTANGRFLGRMQKLHFCRGCGAAVDDQGLGEQPLCAGEILTDPQKITFFNLFSRVHKLIREISVICEEQKTFGIQIQAANGIDARGKVGDEVRDGLAAFFIR